MFTSDCPTCHRTRYYKSEKNRDKLRLKNCRSCANSISGGGSGYRDVCRCGNPKYHKSSSLCRECHIRASSTYHATRYRFKKYGVTREWFEEQQQLGCAICGMSFDGINSRHIHIDHDHLTNKARGVLCGCCNKGLGQFKDSVDNLRKAVAYLGRIE